MRGTCLIRRLVLWIVRAVAAFPQSERINASTFIYTTDQGNLTFALSAASTGDVYMRLLAPAVYQWVGVGTGSEMDGSVMFIIHEGSEKNSEWQRCGTSSPESCLCYYRRDLIPTAFEWSQ
jgi:hypothetical protein